MTPLFIILAISVSLTLAVMIGKALKALNNPFYLDYVNIAVDNHDNYRIGQRIELSNGKTGIVVAKFNENNIPHLKIGTA